MSGNKVTRQMNIVTQPIQNPHLVVEDVTFVGANSGNLSPLMFVAGTVTTALATTAKTVAIPEPPAGTLVVLTFTTGNTVTNPTISFNGGTPRPIYIGGDPAVVVDISLVANAVIMCWFDGSKLHLSGMQ